MLQADGGTRTASITGAFVALVGALRHLKKQGSIHELPVTDFVAATSVGRLGETVLLDLCYEEDSKADVDMNVIKTGNGRFVEVQGTAEKTPFDDTALLDLLSLADKGIKDLVELQKNALGDVPLFVRKPAEPGAAKKR